MLLIDNSAWARLASGRLDPDRAERVAAWMGDLQLATCLPFLLEAGYSARSGYERSAMMADLARLPRVEIDKEVEAAALDAQRELADIGHHRLAPADVMIAACAHVAGVGVLHYDSDYDLLVKHTGLRFRSEWLAQPGVL
ncbi:MAG: PIN domain-containing protein [Solirubrobacterales bacterium]|nr:PIN domain-containing protein [Solirubrobacterales bacterium]